jgi:hypothetical protein
MAVIETAGGMYTLSARRLRWALTFTCLSATPPRPTRSTKGTLLRRRNATLRSFVLVALSLGSVVFGNRSFAKDLEPVEPAKAQKIVAPTPQANPAWTAFLVYGSRNNLLVVGKKGVLMDAWPPAVLKVVSIVDGSNLIVEWDDLEYHSGRGATLEEARAASSITHHYVHFWLKGFTTKP